jgi:Beta-propeller repeat/Abnormal spindle-like microcephaly-assoc'd, ASPM-SPD-2-Hydin
MQRKHAFVLGLGLAGFSLFVSFLTLSHTRGHADAPRPQAAAAVTEPARIRAAYGQLPLSFEANSGQTDSRVKFLARGDSYTLFLTDRDVTLRLDAPAASPSSKPTKSSASIVRIASAGSGPASQVEGLDLQPGRSNYLIGNNPARWHRNVPNYARVRYRNVYPGVDLFYYGNQGQLETDYVVGPGADPTKIALLIKGACSVRLDRATGVTLSTKSGDVHLHPPIAYQEVNGHRQEVAANYVQRGSRLIGIQLGSYNAREPLIIDPVLVYSTFVGGSKPGFGNAIAVDSSGNVYITGSTSATDFPVTPGVFQPATKDVNQPTAYVSKLNAAGTALVFSTYLGGSGSQSSGEAANAIAVDASGNVYVAGATSSADFPTQNPFQPINKASGTFSNCFLSELNPTGTLLLYSTYLGGTASDSCAGLALDVNANVYLTGFTSSLNFPVTPATAIQTTNKTFNGTAFVTRMDTTKIGTGSLIYSTYFGGSGTDAGASIAVDSNFNAYITGKTTSADFPITKTTAFQTAVKGTSFNAFIASMSTTTANTLNYSSYLGGTAPTGPGVTTMGDRGAGIALDKSFNAYVVGSVQSPDFPFTAGAFQLAPKNPSFTVFVARFDTTKTGSASLIYSTALGGSKFDQGNGIAVDSQGNAFVTGFTDSTDFPTTPGAPQTTMNAAENAFLTVLNSSGAAALFSTFFGGSNSDFANAIAIDSASSPNAYITGVAGSPNFPTTPGSFQTTFKTANPFIVKMTPSAVSGVFAIPVSLSFGNQNINTSSAARTATLTNNSKSALTVTSITITGTNAADFSQTNTCGTSLAIAASCTISVIFKPSATGSESATLTITDSDASSPQLVQLSGTGISTSPDFSISISPTALNVTAGASASFTVSVSALNGFSGATSLACSGAPPASTCTLVPASVTPSGTTAVTSNGTITTTLRSVARPIPKFPFRPNLSNRLLVPIALVLALLAAWILASRRTSRKLAWSLALLAALVLSSCSGLPHGGTPKGNFTITVKGTSGTLTHSATTTLTVN